MSRRKDPSQWIRYPNKKMVMGRKTGIEEMAVVHRRTERVIPMQATS
jgi:hypothetical protein